MNTIRKRMEEIRADNTSGASQLTRQVLETLQEAVTRLPVNSPEDFSNNLITLAGEMALLRPNMQSISYYMNHFISEISILPPSSDLPAISLGLASELNRQWEEAGRRLTLAGARLIDSGKIILTGSYSSAILRILVQARSDGKDFSLFIPISQANPGQPAYGLNMAEELARQGIDSRVINDEEIANFMGKIDTVLLGADSVLADGSVINGYPSATIARLAVIGNVPVYVLCETAKISDQSSVTPEPGFDLIPANLVTAVISF